MPIKATMRYHLTPVRMAIIDKSTSIGKNVEKRGPSWLLGMETGEATVESSMELPQKVKNKSALWSSDYTSRKIAEDIRNTDLKEYMHSYVHCSVIYNKHDLEPFQVPISKWVDKKAVVHLHTGILLDH